MRGGLQALGGQRRGWRRRVGGGRGGPWLAAAEEGVAERGSREAVLGMTLNYLLTGKESNRESGPVKVIENITPRERPCKILENITPHHFPFRILKVSSSGVWMPSNSHVLRHVCFVGHPTDAPPRSHFGLRMPTDAPGCPWRMPSRNNIKRTFPKLKFVGS